MSGLISIIVPVYNVKELVEKCIISILNQTYDNYEIIVVDDGSTDGSGILCDQIAEKSSKIFVYHKENGGLSDARNFGISKARGEYYLFIDSDDVLNENFCFVLIEAVKKYGADITSVDVVEFSEEKELDVLDSKIYEMEEKIFRGKEVLAEYFWPKGKRIIYHGLCMKLYKRELFEGIRFDIGKLHEDVFITYKLLNRCKTFVYIDAPYYYYYQKNGNSISNNYGIKNFNDEYEAINIIMKFFRGREDIQDELIAFCAYHYLSMIYRIGEKKDGEVQEKIKIIRKWMFANILKTRSLGLVQKIKVLFGAYFIKQYYVLRKVKNGNR